MHLLRFWGILTSAAVAAALVPPVADAAPQAWKVTDATVTLSLDPEHLASFGLAVADARTTSTRYEPGELSLESPAYSFEASGLDAGLRAVDGVFRSFDDGRIEIPVRGGLALRTWRPGTGAPLAPAFLYDFVLDVDLAREDAIRIRTTDPDVPVPLEVRNVGALLRPDHGELALPMGDVVISAAWAERLGRPQIAGQWIGALDLRLHAELVRGEATMPPEPDFSRGSVLDVLLGELYGITSQGHIGTFPNGKAGLSAATTSCNNGNVNVPWNAPMAETHPTIGLALFRIKDGVIEELGQNWLKHGWFALANDQCFLGCVGGGGSYLAIGCSDTYSAANNGSRFYLGPRREVNPYLGQWESCGSYFDGTPVDCLRDEDGSGLDAVAHRLEVFDEDLGDGSWNYYYEGCYYVANDDSTFNNIGWRRCTATWDGSNWSFSTVGPGVTPSTGAVVRLVGGVQTTQQVAAGDGDVILAVTTNDLGGGQWHYEYALYNRNSDRGIYSFSIPVDGVAVSNVGFRDIDKDAGTDWSWTNDGTVLEWSTDDHATDPDGNWLHTQLLFNFRFDADAPPAGTMAAAGIFKPGPESVVFISTQGPTTNATGVAVGAAGEDFGVALTGANPFAERADLVFAIPRAEPVKLAVLDVTGRTVQVLVDGVAPAGRNATSWNGRDATGSRVASGVYFFRLDTAEGTRTVKGTYVR